jgi:hypothetical protein
VTEMRAITSDGKEVVLRDDSTWLYTDEERSVGDASHIDFRKTKWGMNMEEVARVEDLPLSSRDPQCLSYETTIIAYPAIVFYIFVQDKLVRAKYHFTFDHSNINDYFYDFKRVKEMLEKKYGMSTIDDEIWKNELYKDDYQEWGTAVSCGHLMYLTQWETDTTTISETLLGENFEVYFQIEYVSKTLGELENKMMEQQALEEI